MAALEVRVLPTTITQSAEISGESVVGNSAVDGLYGTPTFIHDYSGNSISSSNSASITHPVTGSSASYSVQLNSTISGQSGNVTLAGAIDYDLFDNAFSQYHSGTNITIVATENATLTLNFNLSSGDPSFDSDYEHDGNFDDIFISFNPNEAPGYAQYLGSGTYLYSIQAGLTYKLSATISGESDLPNPSGHDDSSLSLSWSLSPTSPLPPPPPPPPPAPQIVLTSASKTDASDVGLNYTISQAAVTQPFTFNVYQSDQPSVDSLSVLLGTTTLPASDTTDLSQGSHVGVNLPLTMPLITNPTLPYIVVVADQDGSVQEAPGSVNLVSTKNSPPFTPSQIRAAYGISTLPYDGTGQTIAIDILYNDRNIQADVAAFDTQFNLPGQSANSVGQFLTVENQLGGSNLPGSDPAWAGEASLDVEWVHAIAPGAHILLIACDPTYSTSAHPTTDNGLFSIATGAWTAANQPGVSVVCINFDYFAGSRPAELPLATEAAYDKFFTTPAGHANVTFLAATHDFGAPTGYPAFSPNVVAVGGTTLNLNSDGTYASETGWNLSGGGQSQVEPEPSYQYSVQTTGNRTAPDVAFVADTNTGAYQYDSFNSASNNGNAWTIADGTSLATPCWAAMIALADEERGTPLDGPSQTLPALYDIPRADFHGNLGGNNGSSINGLDNTAIYNEVTGLGSPIANLLVPALAKWQPLSVGSATLLPVTVGSTYTPPPIKASGGTGVSQLTITFGNGTPPGLTFDNSKNNELDITGMPKAAGTYPFTVSATDSNGFTATQSFTLIVNAKDVTSQVAVTKSGLLYNRSTQLWGGTLTLTNTGTTPLVGLIAIEFSGLPAGVTLANASGYAADGNPYLYVNIPNIFLAPGQSLNISVLFKNPKNIYFSYSIFAFDYNA